MKITIPLYKKKTTTVPIGIAYPQGDPGVVPWDLPHMTAMVGHPLLEGRGTITNPQHHHHWFCRQVQTRQLTIRRQLRRRRPQRPQRRQHIETRCFITIRNAIQPRCPFLKFQSIDQSQHWLCIKSMIWHTVCPFFLCFEFWMKVIEKSIFNFNQKLKYVSTYF